MRLPVGATALDQAPRLQNFRRPTNQVRCGARVQPEFGILAAQAEGLHRPGNRQEQPVGCERLLDEIVGAVPDRRDGGLYAAVTAYHQYRQVVMPLAHMAQHVHAAQAAALQPYIEQQHARLAFL